MQSRFSALALAVIFAGLLQGTMLVSFVWPGLAPVGVRTVGWLAVGSVWLGSALISLRQRGRLVGGGFEDRTDALYREAQTEYLKGNWFQAQALLEQVLRFDAGDVDAGLMLASLYRHVRRIDQAREQLRRLDRFELSEKWRVEIEKEHEYLNRLESDPDEITSVPLSAAEPPTNAATSDAA